MADQLTMKQLKTELDELRSQVQGLSPLTPNEDDTVVASLEDYDEFVALRERLDDLDLQIRKLGDTTSSNTEAMSELKDAALKDMETLRDDVKALYDNAENTRLRIGQALTDVENKVAVMEGELSEARIVVTGLRDSGVPAEMVTAQDKSIAEMRTQMESVFSRMTRAESRATIAEENFQRLQDESRRERTFIGIVAGVAAGFTLIVLALALAGMI